MELLTDDAVVDSDELAIEPDALTSDELPIAGIPVADSQDLPLLELRRFSSIPQCVSMLDEGRTVPTGDGPMGCG